MRFKQAARDTLATCGCMFGPKGEATGFQRETHLIRPNNK